EALEYWMPVNWYNGGMEHTTLHLLYSRFWHKFLYDIGVVPTEEPYAKRTSHGMILGINPHSFENLPQEEQARLVSEYGSEKGARAYLVEKYGEMAEHPIVKMSKSLGNVVNPDDTIAEYGADTLRLYEMFIGDFEKAAPWSASAIKGCKRFLDRVAAMYDDVKPGDAYSPENEAEMHKTIIKVSQDIESMKFNTAIAALMTLINQFDKNGVNRAEFKTFITLLNPFAPHLTEELNEMMGSTVMLAQTKWPEAEVSKTQSAVSELAVQVNGKLRGVIKVASDASEDEIKKAAEEAAATSLRGMTVVKTILIKNKIVNFVVKPQ
ncbi:MAG: class I tRNA ligase family protein, partial [Clostridia bacterium]|nr:class I tRNA ligase family protein [Clostridia bacterium]